jgi:hypothetical protein
MMQGDAVSCTGRCLECREEKTVRACGPKIIEIFRFQSCKTKVTSQFRPCENSITLVVDNWYSAIYSMS